jgi:endoglucanase
MKMLQKKIKRSLLCLTAIVCVNVVNSQRLTVSATGSKILKDGNPITLRGVNFGNWLVWEGYMMNMDVDGKRATSQIRNNIKNLLGNDEARTLTFENNWRNNYITNTDFARAKALGYNVIRIPFHYNMFWNTTTGTLKNNGFTWLDQAVNWARANNIYVVFCLHAAPGYQNPTYTCDNPGTTVGFWGNNWANVNLAGRVWNHIANRYRNYTGNEWIAGYDLLNEPVLETNKADLMRSYKDMTAQIRAVDSNHLIFASGNYYGSDFYDMLQRWDNNLVFTNHYYGGQGEANPNPNLSLIKTQGINLGIPLWAGEFGENTIDWVRNARIDYEAENVGWAFWAWKRQATDRSLYSFNSTAGWDAITNFIKIGGTRPSVANTVTWLNEIATRTRLENSNFISALQDRLRPSLPTGRLVWLQNGGRYVISNNGVGPITANSSNLGTWEKFTVVSVNDGKIALRGNNGRYVNSQNGASAMTCNSTAIGGWESFEWIDIAGQVALKGFNGKFVSAEGGASTGMNCNRETVGGWESFNWQTTTARKAFENNLITTEEVSGFSVFPNPVTDVLNFTTPEGFGSSTATLFDLAGKQVTSPKSILIEGSHSLDINNLSDGVYILKLNNNSETKSTMIIKKNL